ncbi:hypothetical protein BRADI_4g25818v3 [Brachypodium distachyon]|uniref:Uncharacterized protein n=1 Tax=Brachypodium distachyon TaxID=15368 RepID=A0A0Q3PJ52_BRADI|nr:hypothetical protein BRADI_4g25818v3 [Brachypodium distachyon]
MPVRCHGPYKPILRLLLFFFFFSFFPLGPHPFSLLGQLLQERSTQARMSARARLPPRAKSSTHARRPLQSPPSMMPPRPVTRPDALNRIPRPVPSFTPLQSSPITTNELP